MHTEFVIRTLAIGVGATVIMDGWLLLLKRLNVPTMSFALLGRWLGHLRHGTWRHAGIATSAPVRHEMLLGWIAHYAIGIAFAWALIGVHGLAWTRSPSLLPALSIGIASVAAPLFILQPALGAGIASSRTPTPIRNCLKSLGTHTVFGVGLYAAALVTSVWP